MYKHATVKQIWLFVIMIYDITLNKCMIYLNYVPIYFLNVNN